MEQLAIRLGHQKTMSKSLVIPQGERELLDSRRYAATLRQADETTSHSTRLSKDDSQVAGYQGERNK
jgi:hypothetical protein